MKVDLAIYSHVVVAPRQCMSVSSILGFNLDFSSCDNLVGFCKSSHILHMLSWTHKRFDCEFKSKFTCMYL